FRRTLYRRPHLPECRCLPRVGCDLCQFALDVVPVLPRMGAGRVLCSLSITSATRSWAGHMFGGRSQRPCLFGTSAVVVQPVLRDLRDCSCTTLPGESQSLVARHRRTLRRTLVPR